MISKPNKNAIRQKRHGRIRQHIAGTSATPRLNVYRSLNHMYAQIIDDEQGITLVSANTLQKAVAEKVKGKTKKESANIVGQEVAKKAIKKGIKSVVFDRGGYAYTGRVSEVAEGARHAGLEF